MTKEFFEKGKKIAKWADNNMTKDEALKDLLEIVEHAIKVNDWKVDGACDPEIIINRAKEALEQPNLTYEDGFAHGYEAHRAEQALEQPAQEVKCNPHPDAPHGFMRDESHSQDRYVCECEYWTPPAQEPVAWIIQTQKIDGEPTEPYAMMGKYKYVADTCDFGEPIPLYTHPAPSWQGNKEFVGLSDDERFIIVQNADWDNPYDIAELIEQALKEKNNAM